MDETGGIRGIWRWVNNVSVEAICLRYLSRDDKAAVTVLGQIGRRLLRICVGLSHDTWMGFLHCCYKL